MKVGEQTDDYLMFIDNGVSASIAIDSFQTMSSLFPINRARTHGSTEPSSDRQAMLQTQGTAYHSITASASSEANNGTWMCHSQANQELLLPKIRV